MLATHLRHSDPTLLGKFLLGFLTWIRIRKVGVEILVQHLRSLLVKVTPLASERQRKRDSKIMTSIFGMCI